jgi:hypothetical protein
MQYLILTSIFFVFLVSLCVLPDFSMETPVQQAGAVLTVDAESPDVFLSVETSSSEIRAGRTLQVSFELRNKQTYDLRNVILEVYDHPCFVSGDFIKNNCSASGILKANRSCMWTWKWESDSSIDLQRNCPIRFKISYDADYSYFQDIAVLPEGEYFQRESEGTLKDIPIRSSSSDAPLDIQITFSEEQPFLENQDYYMYINYYNKGNGLFDKTYIGLILPNNIENMKCYDYNTSNQWFCGSTTDAYGTTPSDDGWITVCDVNGDGIINLYDILTYEPDKLFSNRTLITFIRNKATPSTCSFTTSDVPTMDIKTLSLSATYKYVLDNSISITVKP